jgi:hypothetical protein
MFANGGYMLAAPEIWYYAVRGVITIGLFNQQPRAASNAAR